MEGRSAVSIVEDLAEADENDSRSEQADEDDDEYLSTDRVLERIYVLVSGIVKALNKGQLPIIETFSSSSSEEGDNPDVRRIRKDFGLQQARSLTSIVLVLDYCVQLLQQHKTTTVREVYYAYVTHFRNQKECDAAIRDAAVLLQVPRHALGLQASAKGWFCGDVQIVRKRSRRLRNDGKIQNYELGVDDFLEEGDDEIVMDGRNLWQSVHGSIIGSEWLDPRTRGFDVQTEAANCILVIEKEGIYRRLAQDRFFDAWPCILVTGKGFPDLATRALVHTLHTELGLPVWGLADGNPFGVLILHTYAAGSSKRGLDGGDRFSVPIRWIGLRASQMKALPDTLPDAVFQTLSPLDIQRLTQTFLSERGHGWLDQHDEARIEELEDLLEGGIKMELEALHWLGMDYLVQWLGEIFAYNLQERGDDDTVQAHLEIV